MQIKITAPDKLNNKIVLPASKSISNRALIISALSGNNNALENISECDDTKVMVRALCQEEDTIDIMAAGTAMRFLTAYLSVCNGTKYITGTERMKQRPIGILVDALRVLGAKIEYVEKEGFPPLKITGSEYNGGTLCIPGNVSSQYISALLMIAPIMNEGLTLELTGEVISRPYINMTLQIMKDFGAEVEWVDENKIHVYPKPYNKRAYYVESDWSASSYWYEIMALTEDKNAQIILPGLFSNSMQGDSEVRKLFCQLGVNTSFFTDDKGLECVKLTKGERNITKMICNLVNQPDLAQTLVVTCAMLDIPFHFTGLQSLKIKETDRINALITELKKLGYVISQANDSELIWNGERCEPEENPSIDTYEDHRMAMAFAPCCIVKNNIKINSPQVVSKSYPEFWKDMASAGFEITQL